MDLVGQLQPNATARFTPVTMEQALAARYDREKLLNEIRESL
jgi:allophanate hydrolase subunit 2